METCGLGILYQRHPDKISQTCRASAFGIQSASGWLLIFYTRTAGVFRIARRADHALESAACGRSCGTPSLQTNLKFAGVALRLPRWQPERLPYNRRRGALTISSPSNSSPAGAPPWQCLPRTSCRGKHVPPSSSPARMAQCFCLCCERNA